MTRVGFVGAGRIGGAMVRRFTAAGHTVRVLARSAPAGAALADSGAEIVHTPAETAVGADLVIVCVLTDAQLREVCLAPGPAGAPALVDTMRPGSALVTHTTASPRTVEKIAGRAAARGVDVLDAPVSGGPHEVAAGRITLFVGGPDPAVARVRPVLAHYGDPVLHVGPTGAGQRVKLVNNALFAAHLGLLSDAVDLGAQLGLDESVLLTALSHGSATSRALTGASARGSVAKFAAATGEFLRKDLDVVRTVTAELGGSLGALGSAHHALAGAVAHADAGRPAHR